MRRTGCQQTRQAVQGPLGATRSISVKQNSYPKGTVIFVENSRPEKAASIFMQSLLKAFTHTQRGRHRRCPARSDSLPPISWYFSTVNLLESNIITKTASI